MPKQICVDVNLTRKLVLDEPDSDQAQTLWRKWIGEEAGLVAPPLFVFEGVPAIRVNVTRNKHISFSK